MSIQILEINYILNTFLLLFSATLVMWMAAGFCMLESGLVRSKSTAVICLKNIVLYAGACACYYLLGYNLMFKDVGLWIGTLDFFVFPNIEELKLLSGANVNLQKLLSTGSFSLAIVFFQMVFVATTASIISGALAERVKMWSFFIFIAVFCIFIYPTVGAWTWGNGWLSQMGFKDFAGSTIVHSAGGWAALFGAWLVGPRSGKYNKNGKVVSTPASNVPLATLGTFILWFGWLGFNGGSVLSLSSVFDVATMAIVFFNTNLAAVGGVLSALGLSLLLYKQVKVLLVLNGAIAGLVAITAGPDISNPIFAFIIGSIGGVLSTLAIPVLEKFKIDDVVGAVPAHLVSGIWGTLAVGIFTEASFKIQLIGVVSVGLFVLTSSAIAWLIIKWTLGLRVSSSSEFLGQDITELGIEAYPEFLNIDDLHNKQ
ncbi:MAG: ammonium transporter [Bdellovibrionales bacterium]|nr:ammonium transporter [Bdellovibrionales bacterium]